MVEFFSINNIAVTILGYSMSWLELLGTIFNLLSVILVARKNMWTWATGIIGVVLFMVLFYQIQLYSDTVEQIYYLAVSVYGWWLWQKHIESPVETVRFKYSSWITLLLFGVVLVIGTFAFGFTMSNLAIWFPDYVAPAQYPYLDAGTTVLSFIAMWLMTKKRVESWILWIIVDLIAVWLYAAQDVKFVALLYFVFLIIAVHGWYSWHKESQKWVTLN